MRIWKELKTNWKICKTTQETRYKKQADGSLQISYVN